ncbi:MAG: hypothetical protein ACJ8F7_17195 [Gemmataceae bacterium]
MTFACRLPPELWSKVMNHRQYRANRSAFPPAELAKYRGQWVAFSLDGRRLLAGAEDIERLEEQLATLGEDPQQVALEHIPGPEDDISLGGAELL